VEKRKRGRNGKGCERVGGGRECRQEKEKPKLTQNQIGGFLHKKKKRRQGR